MFSFKDVFFNKRLLCIYFFRDFFFYITHNVLQLKEVATSQNQAKTNITQTFEFSEKIRKYALA